MALCLATSLWLTAQVLAGPFRSGAAHLQLASLVYLPTLLLAVSVLLLSLAERSARNVQAVRSLMVVTLLAGAWGLWSGRSAAQVLFAAWMLVPLFAGLLSPLPLIWRQRHVFSMLFWIAAVGVALEALLGPWPWAGRVTHLLGRDIEVHRSWAQPGWMPGRDWPRLAGFARSSYAAASQLLLVGLMYECFLRSPRLRLLVRVASGILIAATTSKGVLATWVALLLTQWASIRASIAFWRTAILAAFLVALLLPFASGWIPVPAGSFAEGGFSALGSSMGDRTRVVWPAAVDMIGKGSALWLGRGLGGIGTAQFYFEPDKLNPADNLGLFLFGYGGLFGLILCGIALVALILRIVIRSRRDIWSARVLFATALYGITTSVLESPEFSFFFGVAIAHILRRRR